MRFIRSRLIRRVRYTVLTISLHVAIILSRVLPRSFGLVLFGAIGSLLFTIPHKDRERTIQHLSLIYHDIWDKKKIIATAHAVYRELGKNLFDAFRLPTLSFKAFNRIVSHDSLEGVKKAYAEGKGVIMATSHSGCFEMLLHFFGFHGFKTFAIGKKLHDEKLDALVNKNRSGNNTVYMNRSESPRKILKHLQEGMIFGVLIDQDTAVEGVFADFLGRKAYTPSGPIKIAMKRTIPTFVVTTARQKDNTHHVYITGPLTLVTAENTFEKNLITNTTLINDIICKTIQTFPSQWVWMHRRWHRRPAEQGTAV